MKVKLLTKWNNKELMCCCPINNKCSKDHHCEELEFVLDEFGDIEECMGERSYKRVKGAIRQR